MFDWLKNLLAQDRVKNSAGLSDELVKLITADFFRCLHKTYPRLSDAIVQYLLDGENEELLLRLGGLNDAAALLCARPGGFGKESARPAERRGFFMHAAKVPPIVLYRLGKVYEAVWNAAPNPHSHWGHLSADEKWIEALLFEVFECNAQGYTRQSGDRKFDVHLLARACEAGGQSAALPAKLILFEEPNYSYRYHHSIADRFSKLGPYFASQTDTVLAALAHKEAAHRAHVLSLLKKVETPFNEALCEKVVALALGEGKSVGAEAEKALVAQPAEVRARAAGLLREKLIGGTPTERAGAVGLLFKLEGEKCAELLKERLGVENGKKVRAELEKYLGIQTVGAEEGATAYQDGLTAPEPMIFPAEYAFSPEAEADFVQAVVQYAQSAVAEHAKQWDRMEARWRRGKREIDSPADAKVARSVFQSLTNADATKKGARPLAAKPSSNLLLRQIGDFIQRQNLDLVPVIRLAFACGAIEPAESSRHAFRYRIFDDALDWISGVMQRRYPTLTLLDLGAALETAGLRVVWAEFLYREPYWNMAFNRLGLPNDAIWPFFLVHTEGLKASLGLASQAQDPHDYYADQRRRIAFQILAMFPKPPAAFATFLWERALGTSKTDRPLAQACLGGFPNREKLIIQALSDGRKEVRTCAAEWLARLRASEAVEPIKKALAAEKHDEPKAAMMEALERLGEDIDQFLNRKKLLEDAKKAVAQAVPEELAWFPFDALPEVHWKKNKQLVPKEVIRWFLLQAFKLKKVEPGPLQRRYFAMMREGERGALGKFILDSWLTQDTLPKYNQAQAEQEADKATAQMKGYVKQFPQYYPDFDEAQMRKQYLGHYLNECMGSASGSRGILSVAAACCGPEVVPTAEKYIRFWYGKRMMQAKSLVQLLSWIDHPLAIQVLLSVGARFRTKAIQKEAAECADRVAERKGWTREEMADRTVPTAGFSRDGTQVIDYGVRQFTAKLMEDFSIELRNAEGKVIGALPDALKSEDDAEVKALKKDFSASKKELKQVLKLQQERLYEAMCTQRRWRYDEWESYLNAHPIVGRFCQQLVWMAFRADEPLGAFRPLPDGSLTDFDDNPVTLQPDDQVQVAHQSLLSSADATKWRQHLEDYEVKSLFPQFGKKLFACEGEAAKATEITEFEGYLVNSYKLRGRAGKLGYVRGSAEDGGWFYLYMKPFSGLKMQAVIEFTGNTLPEADRTVALRKLYFIRMQNGGNESSAYSHRPVKLSEVPGVMLSECWNDLKLMADDGPGFDKDWEKASAY